MNKTLRRLGWALGALLLAGNVQAADLKVGFVNAARVSNEAPQAESARVKLQKEFEPREQKLLAMQKDLRTLEERLQRDGAIMKEAERRDLERDIVERRRDLRRTQEELREDFNIRRNEELAKLQRQVIDAIAKLAKSESFDLIVGDGVVFASERVDVTEDVIKLLSRESGAR